MLHATGPFQRPYSPLPLSLIFAAASVLRIEIHWPLDTRTAVTHGIHGDGGTLVPPVSKTLSVAGETISLATDMPNREKRLSLLSPCLRSLHRPEPNPTVD
jgi:hypothetical protein